MLLPLLLAFQDAPLPPPAANPTVSPKSSASDKLPPANPLPYEDADATAVLAPVNALFAALTARDPQAMLAVADTTGRITVAEERHNITRLSWSEFTAAIKPGTARLEERLLGTPAIEVDGDIAMVWAPYVFLVDGKAHHCGTDHFDLIRTGGAWKVLNVTYTHRTTGCAGA